MRTQLVTALAVAAMVSLMPGIAAAGNDHGGDDMGSGHDVGDGGHGTRHTNAPTTPGAREITVRAKSFKFKPKLITLAAGEDVTIALTSKDSLHDFVVQGEGHIVAAKGKKTKRGGLRIDEPGTYKFWCSVSGHRRAGMQGTIVVDSHHAG